MISYIVTFHKQNKYINDAISSILNLVIQYSYDYEIIVGLGRPNQETYQIIEKYQNKNVSVYALDSDKRLMSLTRT